ncbi:MAG: hypothetical protein ACKO3R_05720, partial [bacterium]
MSKLSAIREEAATRVNGAREFTQQDAVDSIVNSDVGKLALATNEELKGTKAKFDGILQNLEADAKQSQGQQNVQQGGVQQQIGQTMVQTGTALIAAGPFTIWPGIAMVTAGMGVALTGSNQQQQGQQQVTESSGYKSQANALGGQSDTHFSTAQQLRSEAETEQQGAATNEAKDNPNRAKTQGQQKGYFVGDNLADASASEEDESATDKLKAGADVIGGIGGTTNDKKLVADASSKGSEGTDGTTTNKTLAEKLKDSSNTIAAIT